MHRRGARRISRLTGQYHYVYDKLHAPVKREGPSGLRFSRAGNQRAIWDLGSKTHSPYGKVRQSSANAKAIAGERGTRVRVDVTLLYPKPSIQIDNVSTRRGQGGSNDFLSRAITN